MRAAVKSWFREQDHPKHPWVVTELTGFHTQIKGWHVFVQRFCEIARGGGLYVLPQYASNGLTGIPMFIQRTILRWAVPGAIKHDSLYQLAAELAHTNELAAHGQIADDLQQPEIPRKDMDNELLSDWWRDKPHIAWALFIIPAYLIVRALGWYFLRKAKRG